MAAFTTLTDEDARALARAFELGEIQNFSAIPQGSVNSNHRLETSNGVFFVRIYEERDPAQADADVELTRVLAARIPTPRPLGNPVTIQKKPAAVFPWIEGTMICQAGVTIAHARAIGRALADMHAVDVDAGEGRFRVEDIRARLLSIEDPPYRDARALLENALDDHVPRRDVDLPRGLCHGDLFRDNVLWRENEIVALLDFESASRDVLMYDLAVTILSWCYGATFDRDLVRAMIEGYESSRAISSRERKGLHAEACIAAIRFATTRITDYAMKGGENRSMKDYRRFLDRLAALEQDENLFGSG